jgi:hypothetical protein
MLGSHGISTDRFGNQSWRAEYVCADGFTFPRLGTAATFRHSSAIRGVELRMQRGRSA